MGEAYQAFFSGKLRTYRSNGSGFDDSHTGATLHDTTDVCQMVVGHMSVLSTVLAQRRQEDAVRESQATKLQGLEQFGHCLAILADKCCTCRRRLKRSKVRSLFVNLVTQMLLTFCQRTTTYPRSSTVNVLRLSYDVLSNVMVRDCFRHDEIG